MKPKKKKKSKSKKSVETEVEKNFEPVIAAVTKEEPI